MDRKANLRSMHAVNIGCLPASYGQPAHSTGSSATEALPSRMKMTASN